MSKKKSKKQNKKLQLLGPIKKKASIKGINLLNMHYDL